MNHGQNCRYAVAISPAAIVDNNTFTATPVDCRGATHVEVVVQPGATDIAFTALRLQESDTSGGTYTDVPGATFASGTSYDGVALALPSATDDNLPHVFQGSWLGRKRFLRVLATIGDGVAGGFCCAIARLSGVDIVPETATNMASGGVCRF